MLGSGGDGNAADEGAVRPEDLHGRRPLAHRDHRIPTGNFNPDEITGFGWAFSTASTSGQECAGCVEPEEFEAGVANQDPAIGEEEGLVDAVQREPFVAGPGADDEVGGVGQRP